jgi:hypothetical protein
VVPGTLASRNPKWYTLISPILSLYLQKKKCGCLCCSIFFLVLFQGEALSYVKLQNSMFN